MKNKTIIDLVKEFNNKNQPYFTMTYAPTYRRGWYDVVIWNGFNSERSLAVFCSKSAVETYINFDIETLHRATGNTNYFGATAND